MTKNIDSLDSSGVLAILVRHASASFKIQNNEQLIKTAKAHIKTLSKTVADCDAALRVFGYDVNKDGVWNSLVDKYWDQVWPHVEKETLPVAYLEGPAPEPASAADTPAPPKPIIPTIQEIALDRLQDASPNGLKAVAIRRYVEERYNIEIHEKTVGMTLYRLLKKGLVRREGHIWFFVPQDAETKNPGVRAPGLFERR